MKRSYRLDNDEPNQVKFEIPAEGEHLFQVVDVFDTENAPGKMLLDPDTVCVKLEVVMGDSEGRTVLQRMSLDNQWKGFFATRLFLKAIGEPYKGDIDIDTDRWIGRQLYVNIKHVEYKDKMYANVDGYNFEKCEALNQAETGTKPVSTPDDIAWTT